MRFQLYSKVDEASELLGDPVILAYILTLVRLTALVTKPGDRALRDIQEYSEGLSKGRKAVIYALIRYMRGPERRAFRALVADNRIICSTLEAGTTLYKGRKAYLELISDLQTHIGTVEFSIGEIPIEKLPLDLREHVSSAIAEAPSPVDQLREKVIWQARILASVHEMPAFAGFRCETSTGIKLAWVLKYEQVDKRELLIRSIAEALSFLSLTTEEIYKELVGKGAKEALVKEFVPFLRNLAHLEGFILPKMVIDPVQYYNEPIMLIESSINGSMLSELYGKDVPVNSAIKIALRGLGVATILQLRGYTHAGLSPNIIEVSISDPDKEVEVLLHGVIFIHKLGEWAPPELMDFLSLDPISIISGKLTNYNDIYAIALSVMELLTGKPNVYRRGLNAVLAKLIHGVEAGGTFAKDLGDNDVKKISGAVAKYSSSPEESLRELNTWLIKKEKDIWGSLKRLGPLSDVLQKSLSLDPAQRFPSPLEAYLVLKGLGAT